MIEVDIKTLKSCLRMLFFIDFTIFTAQPGSESQETRTSMPKQDSSILHC